MTFFHRFRLVFNLIPKSLEIVNQELDLEKKKKQALDDLLAAQRISQPTYEHLEKGLIETILDLEAQQRSLAEKMTGWADELEGQIHLLELLLANLEIHHATGEIDDENYEKQNRAILLGLEATKQDLDDISSILSKTVSEAVQTPSPTTQETIEEPEQVAEPMAEDTSASELEERSQEGTDEAIEGETSTLEPPVEQPSSESEKTPEYRWSI